MSEPFSRHDNFKQKFNEVPEAVFELDITPSSDNVPAPKKNNNSQKYKTPDLMKQMDMISEGKTSEEIYKKKKKRKKKKKKPSANSSAVQSANTSIVPESQSAPKPVEPVNSHIKKNEPIAQVTEAEQSKTEVPVNTEAKQSSDTVKNNPSSNNPSQNIKSEVSKKSEDKKESEEKSEEIVRETKEENKEKKENYQNHKDSKPNDYRKPNNKKPSHQHPRSSGFGQRTNRPSDKPVNKPSEPVAEKPIEKKPSAVATAKEIKQATTTKGNEIKIEDYNQIMFSGAIIDEIRTLLNKQGIETRRLETQSLAPIMVLLVKPNKTYADVFGIHTTWMVTGYSNDGRTERLYLSLIYAPALLSDDKDRELDMVNVINEIKAEEKKLLPEFEFSIILSRNKNAKALAGLPEIKKVKEPFSIDGTICGVYSIGTQKMIITNGTVPKNFIRQNYGIFADLISGKLGEDTEALGRYFRRYTRTIPDKERRILFDELAFFAGGLKMDEQIRVLGIINEIKI